MDNTPPDAISIYVGVGRTKAAVRVATTANLTLSAMQTGTTVDGVTLSTSDRVLVKNQTTGTENGIYTIRSGLEPVRATDADAAGELRYGDLVPVTAGSTLTGTFWRLTTANTITIGSTALTFVQEMNAATVSGAAMDNTAPSTKSPTTAFDNTAPGAAAISGNTFSNNAPGQVVLEGESSPVAGITPPTPPQVVEHSETLVAGTHYTVQVGTRSAPVAIVLPDPGSLGQRVEIVDTSGQNATHNTYVNGGTKMIENVGTTYTLVGNYQVLAIYYDGTKWKII